MNRTYPRKVWVLTPSFKPVEVEVVKRYSSWMRTDYGDLTEKGKCYPVSEMHDTKEAVIAHGRKQCAKNQADIDKRIANLKKKLDALNKAEGDAK